MKTQTKEDSEKEETKKEQLYTFDDVPMYARVYYMGRLGWVTGKGESVRDNAKGDHLLVQYKEKHAGRMESKLHRSLVNKFLKKQKRLWVDFDNRFQQYEGYED